MDQEAWRGKGQVSCGKKRKPGRARNEAWLLELPEFKQGPVGD